MSTPAVEHRDERLTYGSYMIYTFDQNIDTSWVTIADIDLAKCERYGFTFGNSDSGSKRVKVKIFGTCSPTADINSLTVEEGWYNMRNVGYFASYAAGTYNHNAEFEIEAGKNAAIFHSAAILRFAIRVNGSAANTPLHIHGFAC